MLVLIPIVYFISSTSLIAGNFDFLPMKPMDDSDQKGISSDNGDMEDDSAPSFFPFFGEGESNPAFGGNGILILPPGKDGEEETLPENSENPFFHDWNDEKNKDLGIENQLVEV